MIELEQEDPIPQGDLALQITALPRETNGFGDIFGGWLVAQMDLAGTAMASRVAGGRVATVATRPPATLLAMAVPARSICATSQPPKMSPKPLVSRGSAVICKARSPCGMGSSCSSSIMPRVPLTRDASWVFQVDSRLRKKRFSTNIHRSMRFS
jgi:hypothetical protein